MNLAWYLILVGAPFAIGATMVLIRHSVVIALVDIETMLDAANLVLMTFARTNSNVDDEIMALFVMVVAATEIVVGLSIIVSICHSRSITSTDDLNLLKNRRRT